MVVLEARHLHKRYNRQSVLAGVSLEVSDGEFLCMVGPSGEGKSVFMRTLAGLEMPSQGTVLYRGHPLTGPNLNASMVFQNAALLPWLTALENVEFGLKMRGMPDAQRRSVARHYLQMVKLFHVHQSYPHELSGGMRQRVGIARALAVDPDILFLDEPFSALDVVTARDLRADLVEIHAKTRKTIVMISHLLEEAVELASRVVVFRHGGIKADVPIKLRRPRDIESRSFFTLRDEIQELLEKD
jgi:NitT/TauT family transport system ATP-binding protein